jgi:hypothetical protein
MPAAIFNGANVKILKDRLKGKSGWTIIGSGAYNYTLPTLSDHDTLVSRSTPLFTSYFQLKNNASPGGTDNPSTTNDVFLYMKAGTGTGGSYDSLYFKSGTTEQQIDPSLGLDSIIRTNAQTINEDITISSTTNGMTAGPITIASTKTVTVSGNWSIV